MFKDGALDYRSLGGGSVDTLPKPDTRPKPDSPGNKERVGPLSWKDNTNLFMDKIRGNEAAGAFLDTLVGADTNAQDLQDKLVLGSKRDVRKFIKHVDGLLDPSKREHVVVAGILSQLLKDTAAGDKLQALLLSKKVSALRSKPEATPTFPPTEPEQTPTEAAAQQEQKSPREIRKEQRRQKKLDQKSRQRAMPPWKRRLKTAARVVALTAAIGALAPLAGSQTDHDARVDQIKLQMDNGTYSGPLDAIDQRIADLRTNIEDAQVQLSNAERPLIVTNEDISQAFDGLQPYLRDHDGTPIFSNTPTDSSRPAYAWEEQHPLSALTTYEMIHGSLPEGTPDPSMVAAQYWGDGGADGEHAKGYYIDAGHEAGKLYMDDGLWLANLEMDRVELLRDQGRHAEADASLYRAREMFNTAWKNWDAAGGGGITWLDRDGDQDPNEQKKLTVSNAPAAELALKLYAEDPAHGQEYLDKAQTIYDWVRDNLYDAQDHLYYDNIDLTTGQTNHDKVSYAQGTMINVGIRLAEVTGDNQYLQDAQDTAATILNQGNMSERPNIEFDAILLKSLVRLYATTEDQNLQKSIKDQIVKYANDVVRNPAYWDRANGQYLHDPSRHGGFIQGQSAIAETLTLASFMGDPSITTEEKITMILAQNNLAPRTGSVNPL